jgi:tetratricopeptide (TPR) repeat protein
MRVILALLALLQATPEQREVARKLFAEGEVAYNRGDYPLAEAKFRASAQSDPSLPGPARLLGLTLRAENNCKDAITWFQTYLKMQPKGKWAAAVKQQIDLCRKQLGLPQIGNVQPQQGTGILVVVVNIDGVVIKVDDLQRGVTPTEPLQVAPGKHTVLLYKQCYVPRTESVDIFEGQVSDLKVDLARDPNAAAECEQKDLGPRIPLDRGRVRIVTDAPSPQVTVDGKPVPIGADDAFESSPGIHDVTVTAAGYETWTRRVVVMRGQERSIDVTLRTAAQRQSLRRWGWIALGVAAAAGAVGTYYGISESEDFARARQLADDELNRCPTGGTCSGTPIITRQQLADLEDSAHGKRVLSLSLLGVSAAAVGTAVVMFVLERGDNPDPDDATHTLTAPQLSIAPSLAPGGAGLSLVRTF